MNAIALLRKDHKDVEDLFDRIDVVDAADDRADLLKQIATALTAHALIEEQHFYPAVKVKNTEALVREFAEDHACIRQLLARLLQMDPSEDRFDAQLARLREEFEEHSEHEEMYLFPFVERMLPPDVLESIGEDMRVSEESLLEIEPGEALQSEGFPPPG